MSPGRITVSRSPAKMEFSSWPGAASLNPSNFPSATSNFAARMNPPQAERASAPPTLTRLTPSEEMSCIVRSLAEPTSRLNGFGATAADDSRNVFARSNSRCIEAIGTRVRVGLESRDRFVQIRATDEETFGASDQQDVAAGLVDRFARRLDSFDSDAEFEQRLRRTAGGVFDRQACDACFHRQSNAFCDASSRRTRSRSQSPH